MSNKSLKTEWCQVCSLLSNCFSASSSSWATSNVGTFLLSRSEDENWCSRMSAAYPGVTAPFSTRNSSLGIRLRTAGCSRKRSRILPVMWLSIQRTYFFSRWRSRSPERVSLSRNSFIFSHSSDSPSPVVEDTRITCAHDTKHIAVEIFEENTVYNTNQHYTTHLTGRLLPAEPFWGFLSLAMYTIHVTHSILLVMNCQLKAASHTQWITNVVMQMTKQSCSG